MIAENIAVIGTGVMGLATARELARKGASVTLFEQAHIGAGTSSTTFAWINSNGKAPESYHQLNVQSMLEHVALQQSSPQAQPWLLTSGTYEWAGAAQQHSLTDRVEQLALLNYPLRQVSRAVLCQQMPELRLAADAGDIWHFPSEGVLFPALFMARLWTEARERGALLRSGTEVVLIEEQASSVTLTLADGERWQGDRVVLAVGRWSESVMKMLGLQLAMINATQPNKIACGFLATTSPLPIQLQANLITPQLNIRPDGGGRLLLQATDLDNSADPARWPAPDGEVGQQLLHRFRQLFCNSAGAKVERLAVGQRARPADGLPAVGFVTSRQRVYLMVTHSGITLSPLLGRLAAEELLEGRASSLLTDYRPDRLLGKTQADFPDYMPPRTPAAQ